MVDWLHALPCQTCKRKRSIRLAIQSNCCIRTSTRKQMNRYVSFYHSRITVSMTIHIGTFVVGWDSRIYCRQSERIGGCHRLQTWLSIQLFRLQNTRTIVFVEMSWTHCRTATTHVDARRMWYSLRRRQSRNWNIQFALARLVRAVLRWRTIIHDQW